MRARTAPQWMACWEYAHRGLHDRGAPENSLAAAQAAVAAGLGIECDIQRSRDGKAMVFHDWELDRLTLSSGSVGDCNSAELEQISLVGSDNTIPTLATFLELINAAVPLLIEVKSKPEYNVEESCVCVYEELKGYCGDCAVMSFDPRVCEWFTSNAPDIVCGLVMREDHLGHTQTQKAREDALAKAQPHFLAYHVAALSNPWLKELRADGLRVLTWTVNSPDTRAKALLHADALIAEGSGLA